MPKKVFKNRISWYMDQLGVTNAEILRKVRVSRSTLERLKRDGETRLIDAQIVHELSTALGVPMDLLFYIGEPSMHDSD
jgi:transcriptional regulator with XRE-family HTH domain